MRRAAGRAACIIVLVLEASCRQPTARGRPPDARTENGMVPEETARLAAIGATDGLPDPMRRAFDPHGDFEPVPAPGPHDWLAVHREPGQTFAEFVASRPNLPDARRRIVYLLPLGDFPAAAPPASLLAGYAAAFFGLEARVRPAASVDGMAITTRVNRATGKPQLLAPDILAALAGRLPPDAYCLIALTFADLYPDPTWNFVFGQASFTERVGVYSFARYDPAFYGEDGGADAGALVLRRSAKVLVHETGHMFGLAHCVHYRCVMNGSNHLEEADSRPLHLCPVCLRKLQRSVGFDPAERYRRLETVYRRLGIDDEAEFAARRAAWIEGEGGRR